ncbi:MAG TPA: helix-turn-helix domain-containing protein [Actinomycetes bacterium]
MEKRDRIVPARAPVARGVLDPLAAARRFDLSLRAPADELAELVEHYWTVRWDLRGRDPYTQHTLPHPAVHLVADRGRSGIFGVTSGRFARELQGRGWAFGVRFRPAGFHPFLGAPLATLTDRTVAVADVLGRDGGALVERLLSLGEEAPMVAAAEAFLRGRLPPADPQVVAVNRIVDQVVVDRAITKVDHLVERTGMGKRRLQRLFAEYVGVSPKWVIQRYRLHEAVERLAADLGDLDLASLARELGYFDQAHFVKDFKALVGRPPARYAAGTARGR